MKKQMKMLLVPTAAAAFSIGAATVSFAATGWTQVGNDWVYLDSDGNRVTDAFRKSGNNWYYLGEDGLMVRSSIVEDGDNYYYVNSAGAMVSNEWREVTNEDPDEGEPETWWFYLQSNGKAVKRSSSGNVRISTLPTSTGDAKFIFDEEGHMLSGWISEDGEMLTDDDAWKEGVYYADANSSGRLAVNTWKYLEAEDDNENRDGDGYWFWFQANGKKIADKDSKKINGRKYRFDENGAAHFDWWSTPGNAVSSSSNMYYNSEDQAWLATGWFHTVPSEEVDPEAHNDDEAYWFYADSNGELYQAEIRSVNGQKYGFDVNGEMLYGLYKITFDADGKTILEAEKIETVDDIPDADENVSVYYFGDSPKEGVMKTGTATIDIDGEKYHYSFRTSGSEKGAGLDKIDKDSIYIKGRRLEAEEGSKYEPIEYDGKEYLVSTSGKIMKNKTNIKDADDTYYCTDKNGVITYQGAEKK